MALGASLNGGGKYGGSIVADTGSIGSVSIAGSMFGGDGGDYCGTISAAKEIKSVTVGGSISASGDAFSASILSYGKLGKVAIGGDVLALGQFSGRITGPTSIESVTIGGSLIGGTGDDSGVIYTAGPITKSVSLGGDLDGRDGNRTGSILAASVPKAVIGGSILSGTGTETGLFKVGAIGDLTIGGDIDGFNANSAGIYADTLKGKLVVNGNLSGSSDASYSGYIYFSGNANSIDIKGGIYGGSASMAGIVQSGYIQVGGTLKSLTLGQITAGTAFDDTNMMLGSVRAGIIDTMVVKGNITGNSSQFALITGQGDITKTKGSNLAIKLLTVGGTVSYANILAGYDIGGTTINGDGGTNGGSAQIGTVKVVGDFLNSSIVAGANNQSASPGTWGSGTGTSLSKPGGSTIASSIAKIVIQGLGSAAVQSGIVAQDIQSLSLGGHAVSPIATGQPGPSTKFLIEVLP